MKRSNVRCFTVVLLPVALIGAWIFPLAVAAEAQQGTRGESKATRTAITVATTATPEPGKQAAAEPSAGTTPTAKVGGGGTGQQPGQRLEDKGKASEQAGGEQDKKQDRSLSEIAYSREAVGIAGGMIFVLGVLFYLQLGYSQRLEQTTYLGGIYRESVRNFELSRLRASTTEDRSWGHYCQEAFKKALPPPSIGPDLQKLDDRLTGGELASSRYQFIDWVQGGGGTSNPYGTSLPGLPSSTGNLGGSRKPGGYVPPLRRDNETDQAKNGEWEEFNSKRAEFDRSLRDWWGKIKADADAAYEIKEAEDKKQAEDAANSAINGTDASLLAGQGPQFVLEFTAIIVIIFSAVILGVLGRLGPEQIGTLLAAIAGYVLGKATANRGTGEQKAAPKA
jgi:hypothetical protein